VSDETPTNRVAGSEIDPEADWEPPVDPDRPPDPILPTAPPQPEASDSPLRSFFGLFLVPLLVVLLCVGIFVGFGWVAYERTTTRDYLADLRSSWRPRRAQAAYELSKILVADPEALDDQPGVRQEVRRLFEESEEPEIRGYLALVLGHTRDPEATATLTAALDGADPQTRIYILWALGSIGDPQALPALRAAAANEDPGVRKTAAFALGELGDAAAIPDLLPLLEDRVADVRWNTAVAVSRLGSAAAVPELERMLDRRLTSQVEGIKPDQQEEMMISAVRALAAVQGRAALPVLTELGAQDPSLKVRQAAIDARKLVEEQPY
jgi:HEAT repeats/PBS lyase HEAT-like repeat